jgi:17beta-estradiol 17-dehydrogenase / very-long-chain 3-oxoacyl-CoA reductase
MISLYDLAIYLGMYQLAWWLYRTLSLVFRTFFGTKCTTQRYGHDSWAVITGGTGRLGRATALHLAREGFNIVLIAKTLPKLNQVAKEIQEMTQKLNKPVKTRVIVQDFSKDFNAEAFEKLYNEKLSDIDISILINNLGIGQPGSFLEAKEEDLHDVVTVNTYAVVLLTQQVIKSFRKRYEQRKQRSLMVNTSDMAAIVPSPYHATYAGTKIFGDFVAQGLQHELYKYGVDICAWRAGEI